MGNLCVCNCIGVVNISASHAVGQGFTPLPDLTKYHHKNSTNCLPAGHAGIREGVHPDSKMLGSVLDIAIYRSLGINSKSRVLAEYDPPVEYINLML